mgnify:CR=1 FL=1
MKNVVYRRKTRRHSTIDALTQAQKIIFAPMVFQAVASLLDFGILQSIDIASKTTEELIESLNLNEYTVKTLLEVAEVANIVSKNTDGKFSLTQIGKTFLYDKMTIVNFNFIRHCCYLGASKLSNSFKSGYPAGLKYYSDSEKLYPVLPSMPREFKDAWYSFDNYYSDNCFEQVHQYIMKQNPAKIFDIGGNTGKFEKICLKNTPAVKITMLDLPENIEVVSKKEDLCGCHFYPINVLDKNGKFPNFSGAILMSQFLDCFSKEEIKFILSNIKNSADKGTYIYILEPFTDNQIFEGAKYSLVNTSLYFTCIANGNSKMYTKVEMLKLLKEVGLLVCNIYENIGINDYTLLECKV